MHVDTGRDVLVTLALEQVQQTRRELNVFEATCDLAGSVREDLAVLARHDRGELGGALLEQLAQVEEDVGALREARVAPHREGSVCRGNGQLDGLDRSDAQLVLLLAGCRVVNGLNALCSVNLFAADDVGDTCHVPIHSLSCTH